MSKQPFLIVSNARTAATSWRATLPPEAQETLLSLEYGVLDAVTRARIDIDRGVHRIESKRTGWAAPYMQEMLNHPVVADPASALNVDCPFRANNTPCVAGYLSELRCEVELATLMLSDPTNERTDRGPVVVTPTNDPKQCHFMVTATEKSVSDETIHELIRKLLSTVLE